MKLKNAISKLEKKGWTVQNLNGLLFVATHPEKSDVISFCKRKGKDSEEVGAFNVRPAGAEDDSARDVFTGVFVGSCQQAIKIAR